MVSCIDPSAEWVWLEDTSESQQKQLPLPDAVLSMFNEKEGMYMAIAHAGNHTGWEGAARACVCACV